MADVRSDVDRNMPRWAPDQPCHIARVPIGGERRTLPHRSLAGPSRPDLTNAKRTPEGVRRIARLDVHEPDRHRRA